MHRLFALFCLAGFSGILAAPAPAQGPVPSGSDAFFEPASATSVPVEAMLPGVVEPLQLVTLSARRDGMLFSLNVREGDRVEANQVLAVTDNREAVAALRVAEMAASGTASIDRAKNELAMAKRHRHRVTQLFAHQAVSEVEIDQATANVQKAEAALKQAVEQQQLAGSQKELEAARLESFNLRAPFAGRVLEIVGKRGQSLARVDPVLTLASLKRLRVELHVPVTWYGRLRPGDSCSLAASAPVGQILSGTLVSCEPVIDAATQTYRCVFEIGNDDERLPAGFTVRLAKPDSPRTASAKWGR